MIHSAHTFTIDALVVVEPYKVLSESNGRGAHRPGVSGISSYSWALLTIVMYVPVETEHQ